jgi:hypothetical protein
MWMDLAVARCLRKLASFGRFVIYDNRGAGLSDPAMSPSKGHGCCAER